jgi:hypothetical protein
LAKPPGREPFHLTAPLLEPTCCCCVEATTGCCGGGGEMTPLSRRNSSSRCAEWRISRSIGVSFCLHHNTNIITALQFTLSYYTMSNNHKH